VVGEVQGHGRGSGGELLNFVGSETVE
jgi:hypothetical protein